MRTLCVRRSVSGASFGSAAAAFVRAFFLPPSLRVNICNRGLSFGGRQLGQARQKSRPLSNREIKATAATTDGQTQIGRARLVSFVDRPKLGRKERKKGRTVRFIVICGKTHRSQPVSSVCGGDGH